MEAFMVVSHSNADDPRIILVVEDDGVLASSLRILLRYLGLEVRTARDIDEAKRQLTPNVSCILLDLTLPDGDGCDVIHYARQRRIAAKVVVITGTRDENRLNRVNDLQPERILHKPANYNDLLDALQSAAVLN